MVKALATIKGYYDYGMFAPIQIASVIAMRECQQTPEEQSKIYEERRDVVCRGLDKLGWTYEKPRASMFVWAKINPAHFKADEGTHRLLPAHDGRGRGRPRPRPRIRRERRRLTSASPWSKTSSA